MVQDYVYHPDFGGGFGLKNVAPALVPELSYEELEIAGGGAASQQFLVVIMRSEGMKKSEIRRLRRELTAIPSMSMRWADGAGRDSPGGTRLERPRSAS